MEIIRVLPTRDGVTLDEEHAQMGGTIEEAKARIGVLEQRIKQVAAETWASAMARTRPGRRPAGRVRMARGRLAAYH